MATNGRSALKGALDKLDRGNDLDKLERGCSMTKTERLEKHLRKALGQSLRPVLAELKLWGDAHLDLFKAPQREEPQAPRPPASPIGAAIAPADQGTGAQ